MKKSSWKDTILTGGSWEVAALLSRQPCFIENYSVGHLLAGAILLSESNQSNSTQYIPLWIMAKTAEGWTNHDRVMWNIYSETFDELCERFELAQLTIADKTAVVQEVMDTSTIELEIVSNYLGWTTVSITNLQKILEKTITWKN